jgi:hypothetical protein
VIENSRILASVAICLEHSPALLRMEDDDDLIFLRRQRQQRFQQLRQAPPRISTAVAVNDSVNQEDDSSTDIGEDDTEAIRPDSSKTSFTHNLSSASRIEPMHSATSRPSQVIAPPPLSTTGCDDESDDDLVAFAKQLEREKQAPPSSSNSGSGSLRAASETKAAPNVNAAAAFNGQSSNANNDSDTDDEFDLVAYAAKLGKEGQAQPSPRGGNSASQRAALETTKSVQSSKPCEGSDTDDEFDLVAYAAELNKEAQTQRPVGETAEPSRNVGAHTSDGGIDLRHNLGESDDSDDDLVAYAKQLEHEKQPRNPFTKPLQLATRKPDEEPIGREDFGNRNNPSGDTGRSDVGQANRADSNLWCDSSDDSRKRDSPGKRGRRNQGSTDRRQNKSDPRQKPASDGMSSLPRSSVGRGSRTLDDSTDEQAERREAAQQLYPCMSQPRFGPFELEPFVLAAGEQRHEVPAAISRYLPDYQKQGIEFMYKRVVGGHGVILVSGEGGSVCVLRRFAILIFFSAIGVLQYTG